jgi:hypothetical protein
MLKTIALAALGYVGYKYYQKNGDQLRQAFNDGVDRVTGLAGRSEADAPEIELAGGPLSSEAHIVPAGDPLTA